MVQHKDGHQPRALEDPASWPTGVLRKPTQSIGLGWFLRFAGVLLPLTIVLGANLYGEFMGLAGSSITLPDGQTLKLSGGNRWQRDAHLFVVSIIGFAAIVCGPLLYHRGSRIIAASRWRFLADPRPPVVVLRAFSADAAIDLWSMRRLFFRTRYEETLVRLFNRVGPCVAIGIPGEPLPEVGADRVYVSDSDWQCAVRYLMLRCAAVVMTVGEGTGLAWEINRVFEIVPSNRILFCVPHLLLGSAERSTLLSRLQPIMSLFISLSNRSYQRLDRERKERYSRFRQMVESEIGVPLPEDVGDAQYLSFGADGRPALLRTRQHPLLRALSFMDYSRLLPETWHIATTQGAIDHRATLAPFVDTLMARRTH
jgi:hypothetical protein